MELYKHEMRKIIDYTDILNLEDVPDLLGRYRIPHEKKIKNLIVFEGSHGVGKTTLLKELHNPEKGIINLYQSDIWEYTKNYNTLRNQNTSYNDQFISSLKSQVYFIQTLLSTDSIHTILVDRWYLTSMYMSLTNDTVIRDFRSNDNMLMYVNKIVDYIHTFANFHTLIFSGSEEILLKSEYNLKDNYKEVVWMNFIKKHLHNSKNYHTINIENVDNVFDIKEKFIKFVKDKLIK